MKPILAKSKVFLALLAVSFLLVHCRDDNSTSAELDAPEIPVVGSVQPDLTFFATNNPAKAAASQNFTNFSGAKLIATQLSALLTLSDSYTSILTPVEGRDPDLVDGEYRWTFEETNYGVSIRYTVTARPENGRVLWSVIWDFNDGETMFEDYNVLQGSIANDESSAEWTINSLVPESDVEVPVFSTNWTKTSDDEVEINSEFLDGGDTMATIDYTQNGTAFTLEFRNDNSGLITIFWDTSTSTGYIEDQSGRKCWDGSLNDTAC